MTEYTLRPSLDALLEHSHSYTHTHTHIHLATKQNPPASTHKPIQKTSNQQLQAPFKHQFPGHHIISMSTSAKCTMGRRTGVSPLNIYIYISIYRGGLRPSGTFVVKILLWLKRLAHGMTPCPSQNIHHRDITFDFQTMYYTDCMFLQWKRLDFRFEEQSDGVLLHMLHKPFVEKIYKRTNNSSKNIPNLSLYVSQARRKLIRNLSP